MCNIKPPSDQKQTCYLFLLFIAIFSEVSNDPRWKFHGLAQQTDVCRVLSGHRAARGRLERSDIR